MSSIFINIAAYHDYELPKTIHSLIKNSSGKHKLFFGVHYVFEEVDDIKIQKYDNIRYLTSCAPLNLGPGAGRYMAHQLYSNEDYYMVIDSHSRALPNWDEDLISDILMYKSLGHQKPLLTSYPASYHYDENDNEVLGENYGPQNIEFNADEYFQDIFKKTLNTLNKGAVNNTKYQKSISGGFSFTVGPYIKLNKDIAFKEEFAVGAMLYTNGFDLLIPTKLVIHHYYSDPTNNVIEQKKRRSIWNNDKNKDALKIVTSLSDKTIYSMFDQNIIGEGFLGKERSLDEYAEYAGLDFKNRTIL